MRTREERPSSGAASPEADGDGRPPATRAPTLEASGDRPVFDGGGAMTRRPVEGTERPVRAMTDELGSKVRRGHPRGGAVGRRRRLLLLLIPTVLSTLPHPTTAGTLRAARPRGEISSLRGATVASNLPPEGDDGYFSVEGDGVLPRGVSREDSHWDDGDEGEGGGGVVLDVNRHALFELSLSVRVEGNPPSAHPLPPPLEDLRWRVTLAGLDGWDREYAFGTPRRSFLDMRCETSPKDFFICRNEGVRPTREFIEGGPELSFCGCARDFIVVPAKLHHGGRSPQFGDGGGIGLGLPRPRRPSVERRVRKARGDRQLFVQRKTPRNERPRGCRRSHPLGEARGQGADRGQ